QSAGLSHGRRLNEFITDVDHRDSVHSQNSIERLNRLAGRQRGLRLQRNGGCRQRGGPQNGSIHQFGIDVQDLVEVGGGEVNLAGSDDFFFRCVCSLAASVNARGCGTDRRRRVGPEIGRDDAVRGLARGRKDAVGRRRRQWSGRSSRGQGGNGAAWG